MNTPNAVQKVDEEDDHQNSIEDMMDPPLGTAIDLSHDQPGPAEQEEQRDYGQNFTRSDEVTPQANERRLQMPGTHQQLFTDEPEVDQYDNMMQQ